MPCYLGQVQKGLKYELMESPAVSGATGYKQLCLAARNEEKRLIDLQKRRKFMKPEVVLTQATEEGAKPKLRSTSGQSGRTRRSEANEDECRCYKCGRVGHIARDCRTQRTESGEPGSGWTYGRNGANSVTGAIQLVSTTPEAFTGHISQTGMQDLYSCLYHSHSDDSEEVCQVRVADKGSRPHRVLLQGVPTVGIVDSGTDITIIGRELLKHVATVAKLKRDQLKEVDKTPKTYDGKPFALHGRMDLDTSFGGVTMLTPVYIKLDAPESLLLSEGVCRQLNILSYHPNVVKAQRNKCQFKPQENVIEEQYNAAGTQQAKQMKPVVDPELKYRNIATESTGKTIRAPLQGRSDSPVQTKRPGAGTVKCSSASPCRGGPNTVFTRRRE